MRRTVNILRAFPFVITAIYAAYLLMSFADDDVWFVATQLMFQSPVMCVMLLLIGGPFHFCPWWKMQCVLPVLPNAAAIWRHFGGWANTEICAITMVAIFVLTIINGIMTYRDEDRGK